MDSGDVQRKKEMEKDEKKGRGREMKVGTRKEVT